MRECTFVHDRIRRFSQRSYGGFFRITSHNRGLRKIVQDKAQGSGREGAYFVYATERTGSCNAVLGNFSAVRLFHQRHGNGFNLDCIVIDLARQAVVEIVVPYLAGTVDYLAESVADLVKF